MRRELLLAAALAALLSGSAHAQQRRCDIAQSQNAQASGNLVIITGPLVLRCTDGTRISASNQAITNSAAGELRLSGAVRIVDGSRTLTAQSAVTSSRTGETQLNGGSRVVDGNTTVDATNIAFNRSSGRVFATGNVVVVDRDEGVTVRGPQVEYFRAIPGRSQASLTAQGGRSRATLAARPARGGAEAREPLDVEADRLVLAGENYVQATGRAVLRRGGITARGNEGLFPLRGGQIRLETNARIEAEQFSLAAGVIEGSSRAGRLEYLVGRGAATLSSNRGRFRVRGPNLRLEFSGENLERLLAGRGGAQTAAQPIAIAPGFELRADSLDARLPGQQLQRVVAIGRAFGEATDTVPLATPRRDWIRGDTLDGQFRPALQATRGDTLSPIVLNRLIARGSAEALYKIPRNNQPSAAPGYNYLAGTQVDLSFREGRLDLAQVSGLQRGIYLDPIPQTPATPQGTPGAAPSTAGVAPMPPSPEDRRR